MISREVRASHGRERIEVAWRIPLIREKRPGVGTRVTFLVQSRRAAASRLRTANPVPESRSQRPRRTHKGRRYIKDDVCERVVCILTCNDPARRNREVRSLNRNSAVSNRPQSNALRKRRPQIRGRTCRDRSSRADTGIPADRPDCTVPLANRPCSNTCRRHRRHDRCSSDRHSRLKVEKERIERAMRSLSFSTVRRDLESPRKSINFSFESARPPPLPSPSPRNIPSVISPSLPARHARAPLIASMAWTNGPTF